MILSLRPAARSCEGMPRHVGASMRPSGRWPFWMAATICASVQLPSPVALSGVRLGPWKTPSPEISKPTSEPPRKRAMSG